MKSIFVRVMIVVLMLTVSSCSIVQKEVPPTEPEVISEELPTLAPVSEVSEPEPIEISNPVTGAEPTAEPEEEIVHSNIPGQPIYAGNQKVNDCSTGERLALGATTLIGSGCDVWMRAKLERPTDAINGDYIAALDIVQARMGTNQDWMFGKIELYKTAAGNLPGDLVVGFEIDTDINSRGDYLILASGLTSTEWTTASVQVWKDQNVDIGGDKPHSPDENAGDGYETLLFDSGRGEDADFAWVRVDPMNGASIEFAFKSRLLPNNQVFAWWAWTSLGRFEPAKMEFVDSFSESEFWKVDNTCSWIFNGKPTNILVNICEFVVPTPTPTATAIPASVPQVNSVPGICQPVNCAWNQYNYNQPWWWDYSTCSCKPTF